MADRNNESAALQKARLTRRDRHRKRIKRIAFLVLVVLIVAVCGVVYYFSHHGAPSGPIPAGSATVVEQVHSSVDKDQDGVDVQVDILQGAKDYVATNPQYESKYYKGGYPDDGHGVCTDVVGFALKAAGYDLRALVNEDIAEDGQAYGISNPDPDIDFRRVKNLTVYLKRHSTSLTCDLSKTEEWQGGDIVTFTDHIGVISDKRNERGVPYVIHLTPTQSSYEEDFLEWSTNINGHYRWSE